MAAAFGYDAFGSPLGFDPAAAGTIYLFGGDGVYDAASGLTLHGNGVRARSGFLFLQRDPYAGDRQDPLSLHKYLYAHANPVTYTDPSGFFSAVDTLVSGTAYAADFALAAAPFVRATGFALAAVGAMSYLAGATTMAVMEATDSWSLSGLQFAMYAQSEGMRYMVTGAAVAASGFALKLMGMALASASAALAAAGGGGTTAVLRNGYYYVNGFKISQYYYNRLWATGRGAPTLVARCILEATGGKGVPDPYKSGFYRYIVDGWELVYNPTTKEIWHLCPL